MATVGPYYSEQYQTAYISNPNIPGNSHLNGNDWGAPIRRRPFTYTQAATGTAEDLVYLVKVPSNCVVIMALSYFKFSAWDNSPTLNVGWLAYVDSSSGAAVAADENGLLDGVAMAAAGAVFAGQLLLASSNAAQAYIVDSKEFNSKEEVTITATLADQAPSATDTLTGWIAYTTE